MGAKAGSARPLSQRPPPPPQGGCCPQLRVLEVSTGINQSNTPLQLPVEALQKGCPQLQVPATLPRPPACLALPICSLGLAPRCCGC